MYRCLTSVVFLCCLTACNFQFPGLDADKRFGKQNFVSAISIIELHKIRNDNYPTNLKELEFLGEWDGIWLSAVRYEKKPDGYNLYVERGFKNKPRLELPERFKKGLGLLDSNVEWVEDTELNDVKNEGEL